VISIDEIVDAIRASPSEFASIYLQAQAGLPGGTPGL
jgi:hypothetical protein